MRKKEIFISPYGIATVAMLMISSMPIPFQSKNKKGNIIKTKRDNVAKNVAIISFFQEILFFKIFPVINNDEKVAIASITKTTSI